MRRTKVDIADYHVVNNQGLVMVTDCTPHRFVEMLTNGEITVFVIGANYTRLVIHYPASMDAPPVTSAISNEQFVKERLSQWRAWAEKQ